MQDEIDIKDKIYVIRGNRVMIDSDLAQLYGVSTKVFNQAIKRNINRFPNDFMFRLSTEEFRDLNRSQIVTGSERHRNQRSLPIAFTEHGVSMLSAVLNSDRAVMTSIQIIRMFVAMRKVVMNDVDRIKSIENRQNEHESVILDLCRIIRSLINVPEEKINKIGFN
jgi:hypothetical protein